MKKTWTKRAFNPQKILRELDRQYGPFDIEQTPEDLLYLLQSEGLLDDLQIGLSSIKLYLERKNAEEHADVSEI